MTATVTIHAAGKPVEVELVDKLADRDSTTTTETVQPDNVGTFHVHDGRTISAIREVEPAQADDSADGEG